MRATISFETDVNEVEGTMAVLAGAEEHNLRAAADILSNYTVLDGGLLDTITEVLRLLDMSATQLRQYQHMMVNFEKAKLDTTLPQPADSAAVEVQSPPSVPEATSQQVPAEVFESLNKLKDAVGSVNNVNRFENFLDKINLPADSEETNESQKG